jgi:hypothetical protein
MRNVRNAIIGFSIATAVLAWSEQAIAATLTLTIDFGGECNPLTITGDPGTAPVVLNITNGGSTFTCGHYKIQRQSSTAGEARLESSVDTQSDVLTLKNAKITKVAGSWPDLHMTISGKNKYEPSPAAIPTGADVSYKVSAEGYFKRGITIQLAAGSYINTRGYQDNPTQSPPMFWLGSDPPATGTGIELGWLVCGTSGCNNWLPSYYNTKSTWKQNRDTLASTRDLQAEFWLKLYNNSDSFNLYNLTVQNTLGGGGGDGNPNDPPGCPDVTCVPSINE